MPIRSPLGGGQGGGAAFPLGPEQNEFTDTAARDAYATANATWLADYDADRQLLVLVGGTDYYRRNVAGTAWEVATGVAEGESGPQARFDLPQYLVAATKPAAAPTGGTYNIETGAFTPVTGHTAAPTDPGTGMFLYRTEAPINPGAQTGDVVPVWSEYFEAIDEIAAMRAETAQTAAETAQTASETAQTAAETAQTAAETAETNAETAQTAAETAENKRGNGRDERRDC